MDYKKHLLKDIFEKSPFYLISTHGAYDLDRPDWYFKVPEKTFIFETQVITDYCLTSIDEPLFDLVQGVNRKAFTYYLLNNKADTTNYSGRVDIASDAYKVEPDTYRSAIEQLVMYGPGDIVPIRELTIGRVGPTSRRVYEGMTLNRFEPGQPAVKFPGTKETLILHERGQFHEELIVNRESTNKELIKIIKEMPKEMARDKGEYRIFFFSSCASIPYKPTSQKHKERIMEIEVIQRNQILKMLASEIYSIRGGPGTLSVKHLMQTKNTIPRAVKRTERFTSDRIYRGNKMSAADPRLVLDELAMAKRPYSGRTDVKYVYKYKPSTRRTRAKYIPFLSKRGKAGLRRSNTKKLRKLSSKNKKGMVEFLPEEGKFVPFKGGDGTRKKRN